MTKYYVISSNSCNDITHDSDLYVWIYMHVQLLAFCNVGRLYVSMSIFHQTENEYMKF